MHNAFVLKVGYWVVLAEYSEQSFTLPDQFWALQGDAKSAETTDDRSYLQVQQLPFDSPDETLVYEDDLQFGNNFVSDGHFS